MYTLYYLPDACSLATQVVLRELQQPVTLINKQQVDNFSEINPAGVVPVLLDGEQVLLEGAAVMLHILNKHPNALMPSSAEGQQQALQDIMFANASMHPAYGRLFFLAGTDVDASVRQGLMEKAAEEVSRLWAVVEQRLQQQRFLGGEQLSAADIMLAVYSRWSAAFPVDIVIGPNTQAMLQHVIDRPTFQQALRAEQAQQAA